MPSSLTIAQKIALFDILDIPHYPGFFTVDGMGTLSKQTNISATASAAYTELNTYLDSLDATNGETELMVLITRWIAIGTQVAKMESGSVGDSLTSVTMDYDRERYWIKDKVKKIVPFYPWGEVLARQSSGGSGIDSLNIGVFR